MKNILTADIGATNSRFAHFSGKDEADLKLNKTRWLKTHDFSSFMELMTEGMKLPVKLSQIDIAIISIAGPVEKGIYSNPPFIPWEVDISRARHDFGLKKCQLINDFVAQAYACRSPVSENAEQILPGETVVYRTVAVIGAGSNLGKAALVPDGRGGFAAVPSEGGHANFPFESSREFEFHDFVLKKLGHKYVTGNKVVSGKGLSYIHKFLTGEECEPADITKKFTHESETLQWASRFYGRACRNYALETLALGGVYVAGGLASKVPALLKHKAFEAEFRNSSTMSDVLAKIPVYMMGDEESGLWGAAFFAMQNLKKET